MIVYMPVHTSTKDIAALSIQLKTGDLYDLPAGWKWQEFRIEPTGKIIL